MLTVTKKKLLLLRQYLKYLYLKFKIFFAYETIHIQKHTYTHIHSVAYFSKVCFAICLDVCFHILDYSSIR